MDDLPVGQASNNNKFKDEQPTTSDKNNADADKPLEERLISKNWSTRADAFKEISDQFKKANLNCANDTFRDYATKWANFLLDNNPGSLEKCLEAYNSFLDKTKPELISQNQIPILKNIVEKCLGHSKPVIKTKSLECVLLMFEISENFDLDTQDCIEELCKSKKLPTQITTISLLATLLTAFGVKKFPMQRYQTHIEAMANHSNPTARTEAMNCYKAIYLWIGDGVNMFLDKLKPAQKESVQKEFPDHKENNKNFKRLTRTEKAKAKEAELDKIIAEETKEEVIDVYDIAAPKKILEMFNNEWIEGTLALKKWDEKRDRMNKLISEADVPKLEKGSYIDLVGVLKKFINDPHIVVQQTSTKAIGLLAKGLRDSFKELAKELFPLMLQRFKEKRLVEEIQTALQGILMSADLNELTEPLNTGLKDKSPVIKFQCAAFLEKVLPITYIDVLEDIQAEILPSLIAMIDEKDNDTREQALKTLGIYLGRLGEQLLQKHTDGIIAQKKAKIEEAAATVKPSKYDKSQKKAAAAAALAAAAAKKKPVEKPKAVQKPQAVKKEVQINDTIADPGEVLLKQPKPSSAIKQKNDDDVEMLETPPPPVVRKPPPNIGQKPPAKVPQTTTNATKPSANAKPAANKGDAKDEDMETTGLSKEESIEKVQAFYDSQIVSKFEDAKWQEKVEGFKGIQQQIEEQKPESVILEATARFIKIKMKDWKESNMNLMKEAIETLKKIIECCERIPKRVLFVYAPFLTDKIGDVKFSASVKEILMQLADFMTAKFVALQVIKFAKEAKAPNNLKESCNFLSQLLEEWGAAMMPVKDCIDYSTLAANNANVVVRNASMQLFATLYKHLGETVRPFLTDIKESTLKLIEDEFKKITPFKKGEFKSSRALKGEAQEEMAAAPVSANFEDSLPREDISKQLNAKLLAGFKDKDWKKRKETADAIIEILKAAKMRIEPNGLGDLMEALKAGMKESNKAVIKPNIQLMGALAEALGSPIKQYIKKCLVPLLFNLSDKQSLVRNDVIECINKWAEAIGPEPIITWATVQLETDNPELREEGLKWILAHKEGIKGADHTLMVKPLVDCLLDKASKIRTQSEEIIVEVMTYTGFEPFGKVVANLKTAVQQAVRPILEKAKAKCGTQNSIQMDKKEEQKIGTVQQTVKRPTTAAGPTLKPKEEAPLVRTNDLNKQQLSSTTTNSFAVAAAERPQTSRATTSVPKFSVETNGDDQLIVNPGNKEKRAILDAKTKWMHEEMKPEQTDKVKHNCEQIFGYEFMQKMFSTDFKKHQEVLKQFTSLISQQPENLKETIDVISKWSCIKLAESQNTTFAVSVFDFFQQLFDFLLSIGYQFFDNEAYILIPMLCDKTGLNNLILKDKVKKLLRQCFQLYDFKKCVQLIMKFGVGAKNLRSVAECLDELAVYIKESGIDNIVEKDLQQIAKLVDNNDKGVRESSLHFIGEVYKILDEEVWRVMGPINIKVKGLLEGRFKQLKMGSSSVNMNRSIKNSQTSPIDTRRSITAPSKQDSLNKSLNKSIVNNSVSKEQVVPATPRRVNPPVTAKNSGLNSLSKSIKKDPLNTSISNTQQANVKQIAPNQSVSQLQTQQPIRQPLKFQSTSQERRTEVVKAEKPGSFIGDEISDSRQTMQVVNQNVMQKANNIFNDADEDLMLQLEKIDKAEEFKEQLDPKIREQLDFIMKHIQSLKYGDLSKRVDSLVALNDIITNIQKYTNAIIHCANELCSAFTHVMVDVFERQLQDIPLRFAKYFVTIVNRVCQSPELMMVTNEKETYDLTEQLLVRLLTENLDKLGESKEGEVILKTLNSAMLRLLENSQPTLIYCALYNLLRKYRDYTVLPKLPGLVIKCLLKLAKIIEKQTNQLDIEKILLVIHEYLLVINHDEKSQNDEMGIRITKTVINELVKIKGEVIWDSYKLVERHNKADNHIQRWIQVILNNPQKPNDSSVPTFGNQNQESSFGTIQQQQSNNQTNQAAPKKDDREIKQIIDELRATDLFEGAIVKLHNYLQKHPDENLNTYLKDLSTHFSNFIKQHLEQYQNSLVETGATPEPQENIHNQIGSVLQRQQSPYQRVNSAQQNPRIQQTQLNSQPQTRPTALGLNSSGSGTGRAPTTVVEQQSSEQKIISYQDKITSMKERLQKSGSNSNMQVLPDNADSLTEAKNIPPATNLAMFKATSQQPQQSRLSGSIIATEQRKQDGSISASFSQMNSSLSQKWKQISTQKAQSDEIQVSNEKSHLNKQVNLASSSGIGQKTTAINPTDKNINQEETSVQLPQKPSFIASAASSGQASDLQSRLAEMKAKLQQINKKKE